MSDEDIHAIWDRLADHGPGEMEAAQTYLLQEMSTLLDASNAMWSGVLRLAALAPGDPLKGWRMPVVRHLRPVPGIDETIAGYQQSLENNPNPKSIRYHAQAGQFRVMRVSEMMDRAWFKSDFYVRYFLDGLGAVDVMFIGAPVNADAEAGLAFFRAKRRFTTADCALAARALRGLRWFQRRLLLGHGLLLADSPLTGLERLVLQQVLEGKTAKETAAALNRSPNTTNEYVRRLYRKFGVTSRGELMALWLGGGHRKR